MSSTRTIVRQEVIERLYQGHQIITGDAELLKIDSGSNINEGAAYAAADATLTVDDGDDFTAGDWIIIDAEIIYVVSISTDALTVVRGCSGTTDTEHADDTDIYLYRDYGTEDGLTAICNSMFAPAAMVDDWESAWIYVSEAPAAVASGALLDEAGNITATQTNFDTDVGGVDHAEPFVVGDGIIIDDEVMRVVDVDQTNEDITVVRGIQGTTAATHNDNAAISKVGPALNEVVRVVNTRFSNKSSVLTVTPEFSCRMLAGQEFEVHYIFYPGEVNNIINNINRIASRGALSAMTTDAGTTILELDVLVDGVLAQLKRRMSLEDARINENPALALEATQHDEAFNQGLVRLGYQRSTGWQQQDRQ